MPQPPRRIQGPDGNVHEFPSDFTDADIEAAFSSLSIPDTPTAPATPKGSAAAAHARVGNAVIDFAKDNLSTIGGIAGGIIGGTVGNVPGAVAGAAIGAGGGEGWQQVIDFARGKPTPRTSTEAATRIAGQGALAGATEVAGAGIAKGMTKAAPWLMEKALKPTRALVKEYGTTPARLVQTLLDEGVNVAQGGVEKLQRLFDATNDEIKVALKDRDALLQRLHGRSDVVSRPRVAAQVASTAKRAANQVDATADLEAIGGTVERFLKPKVNPGNMTLPEAQAMKVGTYQQIGKKYGEMASAQVEAQKGLARGLKDEIAAEVPAISALNKRDSELMAALDAVGRRVALSGGKDPVGFAWATSHPATFIAALLDRSTAAKSLLARGLYTQAARAGGVSPQVLKAALAAIGQSGSDAPAAEPPPQ